ncbi:hypothetical protein TRFO_07639 [Tritrichomonas foetus]|uniref:Thioredoxin-like fold domain-containing protein n=1 Tax=Tritrichomonas foetus TaxID=1144522 RepID=A0A1J4JSI6_9EUKA|nr:hypothetical protein TRFO_07639 [Tritrichomonas foetus]|eukprot:OHT01384.1 hypothetical protein TRFO_07639 [Tritrichomonas foetus]
MSFSATAQCTMPIPKSRLGLTWGPLTAPVHISIFVDPLCPDCMPAWQTIDALIKKYGDKICVTAYMLALPFHTWSFTIQRTITALKEIDLEKAKLVFHDLFTKSQSSLNSASLAGKSEAQAVEHIIRHASTVSGVAYEQIKEKYDLDSVFFNSRVEFKYAGQMGITGTPNFFINGAKTAINEKATVENWSSVLDPLF